ncbi:MAG: hypothetical protein ACYTEQ_01130 [Planctomycetota bacterium]|jgi:hypothetical protein
MRNLLLSLLCVFAICAAARAQHTTLITISPTEAANIFTVVTNYENIATTADAIYDDTTRGGLTTNLYLWTNSISGIDDLIGLGTGSIITNFGSIYVDGAGITNMDHGNLNAASLLDTNDHPWAARTNDARTLMLTNATITIAPATAENHPVTKLQLDEAIPAVENFYMYNTASALDASMLAMSNNVSTRAEQTNLYASLGDGTTFLTNYIIYPALAAVDPGVWEMHVHAYKTAGTKIAQVYWVAYATNTSLSVISTSETSVTIGLTDLNAGLDIHNDISETDADVWGGTNSSLVVGLYAVVSGPGSAPTLAVLTEGDKNSRVEIGAPASGNYVNRYQPSIAANFDFSNFKGINLAAGSSANDSVRYGQFDNVAFSGDPLNLNPGTNASALLYVDSATAMQYIRTGLSSGKVFMSKGPFTPVFGGQPVNFDGEKGTNVANGTAADDTAAFGQIATAIDTERAASQGGFLLAVDTVDWGGWETGEGSLGSGTNNVVFVGYSTPNATNQRNTGWAATSSQSVQNDKYAYARIKAETNWYIGPQGIAVGVRSSSTAVGTNKVNILIDDGNVTVGTNNLVSSSADEWRTYTISQAACAAADSGWTNTGPDIVYGSVTTPGLNVRADFFAAHNETIQCIVFVDWRKR